MKATITETLAQKAQPEAKPYEIRDERLQGFLLRVQPSGVKAYYAEYGRGKRYRIARQDAVKAEAAREKAKAILAAAYFGDDPMAEKRAAKAHTLATFVSEVYQPWAAGALRSAAEQVRSLQKNFPAVQNRTLDAITAWDVEKWRAERLKAGARPATVNRAIDNLKSCLNRAVEWEHIAVNPLSGVKRSKTDRAAKVRYLSPEEETRLIAALEGREGRLGAARDSANAWRAARAYPLLPPVRDRLRPMVLVSLHTGLRRGELLSLTWQDIDIGRAMLTVRGEGAKSGTTRHIPLNAVALQALKDWQHSGVLVFPAKDGGKVNSVKKAWAGVLEDAEITGFRWHDLRHSFASKLVMRGVDLNTVRELLGHSTIGMTLRYAHLAPEHKAAAVALIA
jgi:integrase